MLLEGASPLLREVTLSLVGELAREPDLSSLSREAVFKLAEAAIGTAAKNPKLLGGSGAAAWFKEAVASSVSAVSDQGARRSLTRDGAQHVLLQALGVLGEHPELLVDKPGAAFELVGSALKSVSAAGALDAKTLGTATVTGVLERLAEHPELVSTRYAEIVSALSGQMAQLVATKLMDTVSAGLQRAEAELGRRTDGGSLPAVLAALVAAVAQGELVELKPNAAKFIKVFAQLSESVAS